MNAPPLQQQHSFASDVSTDKPNIRHFMPVSAWLLTLHFSQARRVVQYLNDCHPNFKRKLMDTLPRLNPLIFYG